LGLRLIKLFPPQRDGKFVILKRGEGRLYKARPQEGDILVLLGAEIIVLFFLKEWRAEGDLAPNLFEEV